MHLKDAVEKLKVSHSLVPTEAVTVGGGGGRVGYKGTAYEKRSISLSSRCLILC